MGQQHNAASIVAWRRHNTQFYLTDGLHGLDEVILNVDLKVDRFPGESVLHLSTRQQCLTMRTHAGK